ncbi:hypothetical protein QTP70_005055 [Hemibagrus guttatus]|uniref:Endonuclease/exonuclease/phosphatase domain-containing protein n=1 Tax=Hemibagrus guttatus TaxID=175788 RepID=A0AAE0UJL8_9TELE|nr:hypothetical protein QTP70_005055 [Hemibagrus guttatus]
MDDDRVPDIQLDRLTMFCAARNAALCVEFVTVRCRPFYLPREFIIIFIVRVYIPPSTNAKEALCELYRAISELQNAHPDGLFIIAGDYNHANLKSVLPKFHQRTKPVLKQVKTWPAGAISARQDCFECTDWDMFREAATNGKTTDLEEYISSVTSYISKCIDDVTISKSITTRSNQKPWMTAKVRALLKSRDWISPELETRMP